VYVETANPSVSENRPSGNSTLVPRNKKGWRGKLLAPEKAGEGSRLIGEPGLDRDEK